MIKKLSVIGVALAAVGAFCAFASASAFALPAEWLVSKAVVPAGSNIEVDILLLSPGILLEDMKEGIDVLCTAAEGTGLISGPTSAEVTAGKCTAVESMTSGVTCAKVTPIKLPWSGTLTGESTEALELIKSVAKTGAGWEVECTVLGIKAVDTCTTEEGKPKIINNLAEEEAEAEFVETPVTEIEEAACTLSKAEHTGLVVGNLMLKALVSGVLLSLEVS